MKDKYRILKSKGFYYIEYEVKYTPYYMFPMGIIFLIMSIWDKSIYAERTEWVKRPFKFDTEAKARLAIYNELQPDEIILYQD